MVAYFAAARTVESGVGLEDAREAMQPWLSAWLVTVKHDGVGECVLTAVVRLSCVNCAALTGARQCPSTVSRNSGIGNGKVALRARMKKPSRW